MTLSGIDIGSVLPYFLINPSDNLCTIQAFFFSFFQLASVLWTVIIAQVLYETIVLRKSSFEEDMPRFHAMVWIPSLVMAAVPLLTDSYGDSTGWCWIIENNSDIMSTGLWLRMICFYIPLWCSVAFYFIAYFKIKSAVSSMLEANNDNDSKITLIGLQNRLKWYPRVLAMCFTMPTVNRLYQCITGDIGPLWLIIMAGCSSSLQGAFNVAVYGTTSSALNCWLSDMDNFYTWISGNIATLCTKHLRWKAYDADNSLLGNSFFRASTTSQASESSSVTTDSISDVMAHQSNSSRGYSHYMIP